MAEEGLKIIARQEKTLARALHFYQQGVNSVSTMTPKLIKNFSLYEGIRRKEKTFPWPGCSAITIPMIAILQDTLSAHLTKALTIFDKPIKTSPVGDEDENAANNIGQLLNHQYSQNIDAFNLFDTAFGDLLQTGTGFLIPYWCKASHSFKIHYEPIEKILVDDYASDPHDPSCAFVGRRIFMLPEVFKAKERYPQEVREKVYLQAQAQWQSEFQRLQEMRIQERSAFYLPPKMVEIVELYFIDEEGKEKVMWLEPTSKTQLAIEDRPKDRWPVFPLKPYPRSGRVYGRGFPEILEQINKYMNVFFNSTADASMISIAKPLFYRGMAGLSPQMKKIVPGGAYPVPEPTRDIYYPEISVSQMPLRLFDILWQLAERLTGIPAFAQGYGGPASETATKTMALTARMEVRFEQVFKRITQVMDSMLYFIYDLTTRNKRNLKPFDIISGGIKTTKKILELLPDSQTAKYNFKFKTKTVGDEQKNRMDTEYLYKTFAQDPLINNSARNAWKLREMLWEAWGRENLDKVFDPPLQASLPGLNAIHYKLMKGEDAEPSIYENAQQSMEAHLRFLADNIKVMNKTQQGAFIDRIKKLEALSKAQALAQGGGNGGQQREPVGGPQAVARQPALPEVRGGMGQPRRPMAG